MAGRQSEGHFWQEYLKCAKSQRFEIAQCGKGFIGSSFLMEGERTCTWTNRQREPRSDLFSFNHHLLSIVGWGHWNVICRSHEK